MGSVMTVTGEVDESELGRVLPHEHLFVDLWRPFGREGVFQEVDLAVAETEGLGAVGVGTLVDVTPVEVGRNPLGLRTVAETSGLNIVMGCGHYREPYLDNGRINAMDVGRLADEIVSEITDGVGDTGVRPGVIGEVASEYAEITAVEERCLRAAARAHVRTGLTLTTHAAVYPSGLPQLVIFESEGVDLTRVVIGHCDTVPDPDYHLEIARRGAYVQFDTIRAGRERDLSQRVDFIRRLADAGFVDRVLLSHDICLRPHLRSYGGSGLTFVPGEFSERLRGNGFTEVEVDLMTRVSPARAICH